MGCRPEEFLQFVYAISIGGKVRYVGSTVMPLSRRLESHRSALQRGRHDIPEMQAEWDRRRGRGFKFFAIDAVTQDSDDGLLDRESHWIKHYDCFWPKGFNRSDPADTGSSYYKQWIVRTPSGELWRVSNLSRFCRAIGLAREKVGLGLLRKRESGIWRAIPVQDLPKHLREKLKLQVRVTRKQAAARS